MPHPHDMPDPIPPSSSNFFIALKILPPDIRKKLVPVFLHLSDEALLKCCKRQNDKIQMNDFIMQ